MKQTSTKSLRVRPWTYQQLESLRHEFKVKTVDGVITKLLTEWRKEQEVSDVKQNQLV